ncbi:hypothetical protein [Streptomyces sp. OP7]|uniref:hypothetical protein n=1 Tax=Streptomyces sp. OP7 TaxID=3142462 RepID=UPI0032E881E3
MARRAFITSAAALTAATALLLTGCGGDDSSPDDEELRSGYAAITANAPESEALAFYHTEAGLSQAQQWIRSYTDTNLTVIGDLPVFDPEVTLGAGGNNAVLTYCTDESEASSKDLKTGDVAGNPPGMAPEVFHSLSMTKSKRGVLRHGQGWTSGLA